MAQQKVEIFKLNYVALVGLFIAILFTCGAISYSTGLKANELVAAEPVLSESISSASLTIFDNERQRLIPVELYPPSSAYNCSIKSQCKIALLSSGYGLLHTDYGFIASALQHHGYLVIAIHHELPIDPALSVTGDLYQTRSENWQRGTETLEFVREYFMGVDERQNLKAAHFDFNDITLIGHSNGGDISAWLTNHQDESNGYITRIITLDHRRVPLPRDKNIRVLSIRASDFPADSGVLPNKTEQTKSGHCVVTILNAKHNDMSDYGPSWLKAAIKKIINAELNAQVKQASCDELAGLN